jgi:hypothetical protein
VSRDSEGNLWKITDRSWWKLNDWGLGVVMYMRIMVSLGAAFFVCALIITPTIVQNLKVSAAKFQPIRESALHSVAEYHTVGSAALLCARVPLRLTAQHCSA